MQLKGGVTLGDLETRHSDARFAARPMAKIVPMTLKPQQDGGRLATIGIGGPLSLTLSEIMPIVDDSPAARAKLVAPGRQRSSRQTKRSSSKATRSFAWAIVPVKDYREFAAELAQQPSTAVADHGAAQAEASRETLRRSRPTAKPATQELTFEVPTQSLRRFDFDDEDGADHGGPDRFAGREGRAWRRAM